MSDGRDQQPTESMSASFIPLSTFKPATLELLREIISEMTIKTAFDDPLPAHVYKSSLELLLPYLLDLVNLSLLTGDISGQKDSTISPILKKKGFR